MCDYCHFTFDLLKDKLPSNGLPVLLAIDDHSGVLISNEKKSIFNQIRKIEQRYPQLHIKTAIYDLASNISIGDMALWMLNECPSSDGEDEDARQWTILTVLNPRHHKAALAVGYKAERYFTQGLTERSAEFLYSSIKHRETPHKILLQHYNDMLGMLDESKRALKKQIKILKQKQLTHFSASSFDPSA